MITKKQLQMWLFEGYVRCLVWLNHYKRKINYYFGMYSPLWIIIFLVKYYKFDQWHLNDCKIYLRHIEYAICDKRLLSKDIKNICDYSESFSENSEEYSSENCDECLNNESDNEFNNESDNKSNEIVTSYYCYDITARSAWYFGTIGNDYDGYVQYAQQILPADLNEHLYDNIDNSILVKYDSVNKQSKNVQKTYANTVILGKNGEYRLQINNSPFKIETVTFNTLSFLFE